MMLLPARTNDVAAMRLRSGTARGLSHRMTAQPFFTTLPKLQSSVTSQLAVLSGLAFAGPPALRNDDANAGLNSGVDVRSITLDG